MGKKGLLVGIVVVMVGWEVNAGNVKPVPPVFWEEEGIEGRNYQAVAATDPLCTSRGDSWENVYVSAYTEAGCPISGNEIKNKMKAEVTRFRLKAATQWWDGIIRSEINYVELKRQNAPNHWVYEQAVGWHTEIGQRGVEVEMRGVVGIVTGRSEARGEIMENTGELTERFLTKYVEANVACHGR